MPRLQTLDLRHQLARARRQARLYAQCDSLRQAQTAAAPGGGSVQPPDAQARDPAQAQSLPSFHC